MTLDAVNPYTIPHSRKNPVWPLHPFKHAEHRDLYVKFHHSEIEYDRFQADMGDLGGVLNIGGLLLVTGDTGCGKTTLLNRCTDWLVCEMATQDVTCVVVDVTSILDLPEEQGIEKRLIRTSEKLHKQLKASPAIMDEARVEFDERRHDPAAVYENIATWLEPKHALAILLPSPVEIADEVVNYAKFASERVMFFAESGFLTQDHARSIVDRVSQWIRPITLHAGPLEPGDVHAFVEHRQDHHRGRGSFPRMSEGAMTILGEQLQSVKQLQSILEPLYEHRLKTRIRYRDSDWVTAKDIEEWIDRLAARGSRRVP